MASKIPTIDFCKPDLKPGTAQWDSTKAQVFQALKEYGCFEAIYDKIPKEIGEAMFDTLKEIFPLECKLREYLDKPFARYQDLLPHTPFNDIRRTADLLLPESVETFVNTFWPDGNPHNSNVVNTYSKSLMELDEMLKRMILESLGLKNYIDEFLAQNSFLLRLINYKKEVPQGEDVNKPRLIGHTDTGFLTIVKQDQAGLQVQMKNGDWIEPNVSPNSFVVLVADSLMAWTNGQLSSAFHRVKMAGDIDRFSIMLFASPKPGCIVEAPKELVDEEHPMLFKPYDIVGYYKHVISGFGYGSLGYGARDLLKAYCGV
ncbi:probable 2-oxoglutarate-dependent dioxygenase AOP1 [Lycium ferocissimum]|uniref:probable 2-oxoglutarate-dependent dioxygenase AOP1 n=1 Tax=Lycium ferocissimum TaxID=112874 RepID=UPI002815385A|nr:probable 2-oxoglutarate-dependent dioxygenase AOP1 [Lycium ferocissimum]